MRKKNLSKNLEQKNSIQKFVSKKISKNVGQKNVIKKFVKNNFILKTKKINLKNKHKKKFYPKI